MEMDYGRAFSLSISMLFKLEMENHILESHVLRDRNPSSKIGIIAVTMTCQF
jgi:hypothetical protein